MDDGFCLFEQRSEKKNPQHTKLMILEKIMKKEEQKKLYTQNMLHVVNDIVNTE